MTPASTHAVLPQADAELSVIESLSEVPQPTVFYEKRAAVELQPVQTRKVLVQPNSSSHIDLHAAGDAESAAEVGQLATNSRHEINALSLGSLARWERAASTFRWRWLFPLYRRINLPWVRQVCLIEILVMGLFVLVNGAVFISALVTIIGGMGNNSCISGTTPTSDPHPHGGDGSDSCIAQDAYNAAVGLGTLGEIDFLLLFLPATRNSVLCLLFGISVDRAINWHKWLARITLLMLALHGIGILSAYYYQGLLSTNALDGAVSLNGSGEISLLAGIAIAFTSIGIFRRFLFETFLRLHWVLFLVFMLFGFIHNGGFIALGVIAIIPWAVDWYVRIKVWKTPVKVLDVTPLSADVTRIDFDMNMRYSAGQWVMVCIPAVSPFEWHPFSLSSSPHHRSLMIHVRALGSWTKRLQRLALDKHPLDSMPTMFVEGPYGSLTLPLHRYQNIALISAGIGITPLMSVYNSLVYDVLRGLRTLHTLRFVWTVRQASLVKNLYGASLKTTHNNILPASFSPDLIIHSGDKAEEDVAPEAGRVQPELPASLKSALHSSFHLTSGGSVRKEEEIADLKTQFGDRFVVGRPDLVRILTEVKERAIQRSDKRVAVLVCGPLHLTRETVRICVHLSNAQCTLDVHTEEFEF